MFVKKKTGFRRSELKGGNHEKVHRVNSNDPNHDLIRAITRRHFEEAAEFLASSLTYEEEV